jgi:uncharacterized protein YjiS (DUF1127 family)
MTARLKRSGLVFGPTWPRGGELQSPLRTIAGTAGDAARRCLAFVVACVIEWRRRRRSRYELMTFSYHELWDITTTRDAADIEASKPFWRE